MIKKIHDDVVTNSINLLDELLTVRESKRDALKKIDGLIRDGIKVVKQLPKRWYVRNPNERVVAYLAEKYNRHVCSYVGMNIGLGERNDEFVLVPHDINYSWEITQEEFDLALSVMGKHIIIDG